MSAPVVGIVIGACFVVAGALVALLPMLTAVAIGWWIGQADRDETIQNKYP